MNTTELVRTLITKNIEERIRCEFDINDEELGDIILNKISSDRINDILNFDKDVYKEGQCCARVWRKSIKINNKVYNFKKVDSRCNFRGSIEIDECKYCKKHANQLNENGYLRLLRYDEECPKRDIIGYLDKEYVYGAKRVWYDCFNKQLETLLRYHNEELEKLVWTRR